MLLFDALERKVLVANGFQGEGAFSRSAARAFLGLALGSRSTVRAFSGLGLLSRNSAQLILKLVFVLAVLFN